VWSGGAVAACTGVVANTDSMLKMKMALRQIAKGFAIFLCCLKCKVFSMNIAFNFSLPEFVGLSIRRKFFYGFLKTSSRKLVKFSGCFAKPT
jgi:hypothetical protein